MSVTYKPESISSRVESPAASAAFEDYWRLGRGRSVALLAENSSHPKSTLQAWASMFSWKQRVATREAQAALEIERLRRQEIADMESVLYRRGMESITRAADRLEELLASNRVGAVAAIQLMKLGMEMATRGLRQPSAITREEVVNGDQLSLRAVLSLLPEQEQDAALEAAFWELQSRGDLRIIQGEVRPAAELEGEPDTVREEAPQHQLDA